MSKYFFVLSFLLGAPMWADAEESINIEAQLDTIVMEQEKIKEKMGDLARPGAVSTPAEYADKMAVLTNQFKELDLKRNKLKEEMSALLKRQQEASMTEIERDLKRYQTLKNEHKYHVILGFDENIDKKTINPAMAKKSFHKLILKYHPDKCAQRNQNNQSDIEKCNKIFQIIQESYNIYSK